TLDVGLLWLTCGDYLPPRLARRWYRQPQASFQGGLVARDRKLAVVQGVDAAAGVLVQQHARIRELRAARASLQQLDAELFLQLADVPAEGRQGHPGLQRRGRKAARANDGDEHL